MKKPALIAALAAIAASFVIAACGDDTVVSLVPNVTPAVGKPGDANYKPAKTVNPGEPDYKPSYSGMPKDWKPPADATILSPAPTKTSAASSSASSSSKPTLSVGPKK